MKPVWTANASSCLREESINSLWKKENIIIDFELYLHFLRYNIIRLDTDKERIIELKEKPEENFQSDAWSKNKTKNSESNMRYLEDIVIRPKAEIVRIEIGILEGETERENGAKAKVADGALKLLKDLKKTYKLQEE